MSTSLTKVIEFPPPSEGNNSGILASLGQTEQWVEKLTSFLSNSSKNILEFSKDSQRFLGQFFKETEDNEQYHHLNQFGVLIGAFNLQLSHFEGNFRQAQMELGGSCKRTIGRFRTEVSQPLVQAKSRVLILQQAIRDINSLLRQSQDRAIARDSKESDPQSRVVCPSSLATVIREAFEQFSKATKEYFKCYSVLESRFNQMSFEINSDLISLAKKHHTILDGLFKSLLEEVSNKFPLFQSQSLNSLTSSKRVFCWNSVEMTLQEYHDSLSNCDFGCGWIQEYFSDLQQSLTERSQLYSKYVAILVQFFQILGQISSNKHKTARKESLEAMSSRYPFLIHPKTIQILESLDCSSSYIMGLMEKLVKNGRAELVHARTASSQIEELHNRLKIGLSILRSKQYSQQNIREFLSHLDNIHTLEIQLSNRFQENVCNVIQQVFMSLSETRTKLLMNYETYFGISIRDTMKQIKAVIHPPHTREELVIPESAFEAVDKIVLELGPKIVSLTQKEDPVPVECGRGERVIGQFYAGYTDMLGVLTITNRKLMFSQVPDHLVKMLPIQCEEIVSITAHSLNTTQILASTPHKFNLFHMNKFVHHLLRTLFVRDVKRVGSKQSLEGSLSSTIENSEEDEEEETIEPGIDEKQLQDRVIRLKDHLNQNQETLLQVELQNTTAMHLLDVMFRPKEYSANRKKSSQFYVFFKDTMKEQNLQSKSWDFNPLSYLTPTNLKSGIPLFFKRKFNYDHPLPSMGIPFLPKTCKSSETQTLCIIDKHRFTVDTHVESTGAPYTDTFTLRVRMAFCDSEEKKVKVVVGIEFQWLKKTMMKGVVQKQALGETKAANESFFAILKGAIKSYPLPENKVVRRVRHTTSARQTVMKECGAARDQQEVLDNKQLQSSLTQESSSTIERSSALSQVDQFSTGEVHKENLQPKDEQGLVPCGSSTHDVSSAIILLQRYMVLLLISMVLQYLFQ